MSTQSFLTVLNKKIFVKNKRRIIEPKNTRLNLTGSYKKLTQRMRLLQILKM